MPLFPLIALTGISFNWDTFLGSYFLNSFNVWSTDLRSKWKFGSPSFDILPLIAFTLGWFSFFKISASIRFNRFN